MKYRAEIDGLRALAVVPVILFHAGFNMFSGGYVGVDVFFVISGYLITSILIEDIEAKRYSIGHFYERRARRILPALFFVMFICIPFAWMWMLPNQMKDFSQSLVAVTLFGSNALFWLEGGYFIAAAEERPLLHTWSLAVEEQYYLLFPIFLILAWRFGKNKVFWMIVGVAVISLLVSEWGWRNKPSANFYLAPTRAWELLAGSIAAFIVQKKGVQSNNSLALFGLIAIIFSIFAYDETTPFPSVHALVPVVGVVLLILFADKDTLVARLLSTKALVGTGLISYSAYLWHQPLFSFAKIKFYEQPPVSITILLIAVTFFLAMLSWRFVEQPFRSSSVVSRKTMIALAGISASCFLAFGLLGVYTQGFDKRFSENDLSFLSVLSEDNGEYTTKRFRELETSEWIPGKKKILLVGDSYAKDLTNAVFETDIKTNVSLITWAISARCGNLYLEFEEKAKYIKGQDMPRCRNSSFFQDENFLRRLREADEVWFASRWKHWQAKLLPQSLELVSEVFDGPITVFGRKDFPSFRPQKYVGIDGEKRINYSEALSQTDIYLNQSMRGISRQYKFIDTQSLLCGGDVYACKVFDHQGNLKTYDGVHLTFWGARFYGESLLASDADFK